MGLSISIQNFVLKLHIFLAIKEIKYIKKQYRTMMNISQLIYIYANMALHKLWIT
jgi:hypothetical protein